MYKLEGIFRGQGGVGGGGGLNTGNPSDKQADLQYKALDLIKASTEL